MANILVVDDEEIIREILKLALVTHNHSVTQSARGEEAITLLGENIFDLAIVDLKLGAMDGLEVLKVIKDISPDTEVIIITGYGTMDAAVSAMRMGAYDFITKPLIPEEILIIVNRALEKKEITKSVKILQTQVDHKNRFADIIGVTSAITVVINLIEKVCRFDSAVLLTGESGTGKELVARTIYANSSRRDKPFIPVNCAAIPNELQESEFFGHAKGAFTDAIRNKKGLFEEAHTGIIFLDEIADASLSTQLKLLRFLEDGEIRRVGENTPVYVNVRLISATNKDILKAIEEKTFREDLYYRINVIEINIPPLRERKDDIPLLAQSFIHKYTRGSVKKVYSITKEALSILMEFNWPGNVRELQNVIQHAVALTNSDSITPEFLPPYIKENKAPLKASHEHIPLHELEKEYIIQVLEECSWNFNKAAEISGLGRATIYRKLKNYHVVRKKN